MGVNDSVTLVGSNEDYHSCHAQLFFVPAEQGRHGYALFGYNGSIQSGVNDQGLFWDGLRAYPYVEIETDLAKDDIGGNVLYKILEDCCCVEEVIHLFDGYQWKGFELSQLMVVDKTGSSVILSSDGKGLTITPKVNNYQICSNFRIINSKSIEKASWNNIGNGRYKKTNARLRDGDFSEKLFLDILSSTKQQNPFSRTIYSTVFNLQEGKIVIAVDGNFDQLQEINLYSELSKGKHSYFLRDLVQTSHHQLFSVAMDDNDFITPNDSPIYLNKDWKEVSCKRKAAYYRIIEAGTSSDEFIVRDYLMEGQLQGVATCSSLSPEIAHGKYAEYAVNGSYLVKGQFKHRLKDGLWIFYNRNGDVVKRQYYIEGILQ